MASIRKKVILSFLIAILAPLLFATFFSVYFLLNKVEQEALSNVRQDINFAALIYSNKIKELKSFSKLIAKDRIIAFSLKYDVSNKLVERLQPYLDRGDVTQVTVTDARGNVVVDLPGWETPGDNIKSETFVQKALIGTAAAGSEKVIHPLAADTRSTLSLTAAEPVFDHEIFTQIGTIRVRYHVGIKLGMLHKISGSIRGRVDLFLGTDLVASSSVESEKPNAYEIQLSQDAILKTMQENKPQEQVIINKNGYLAEFKPIVDLNYRPIGVMAIHTPAREFYELRIKSAFSILVIALFALLLGLFIGYRLQQGITDPIIELTEQTTAVARGDLKRGPISISSRDEIGILATSFNKMTEDLRLYIKNLEKTTAERERMAKELEIAFQIQQNFLPSAFPELEGVRIFGESVPAQEVGGDFFDVFMLDSKRVGLIIADVAGKGVPAALFMALSRSLLKITAMAKLDPSKTLGYVNKYLSEDNDACYFVTAFYGILDIETKKFTYSNGGHNYPLILRRQGGKVEELPGTGDTALGIVRDLKYRVGHTVFNAGDVLLLYTDGIVDALNMEDRQFGLSNLKEILMTKEPLQPANLGKSITRHINTFSAGRKQFDDITYLIVKFE
jgi:serine phosphatase RsbU (regulator of sigma subunit)